MTWIDIAFIVGGIIAVCFMIPPVVAEYRYRHRGPRLEYERARVIVENDRLADEAVERIRELAREDQRRDLGRSW